MSNDEIIQAALKQVLLNSGSGATVDDPRRLGQIHPLLAPSIEHSLISGIYGDKDKDWFDAGRRYHKDNSVCEQLIRVSRIPKPDWAKSDHIYSMFFDISEFSDSAPVPDDVRKGMMETALKMPVPDAAFASRFPLTPIKARDPKEAARIIAGYLAQAEAAGWKLGCARALVDDWRNEYDITRGDEKTVFRFDMRPILTSPSRLELVALTLIAGTAKLEEVIRRFESTHSWPEAFAGAGLSFVDTSKTNREPDHRPRGTTQPPPIDQVAIVGPPGGWARYGRSIKSFDLRNRINMLNGFYASVGTRTLILKGPDYLSAAARESIDVSPQTMGFVTNSKQLYLNVDHVQSTTNSAHAYVRLPAVTTLHGPTFAYALCYGFYRLVCMFVGKDEFPTDVDVIQHARDLKKWEWEASRRDPSKYGQLALQHMSSTLHFMREFSEATPLEPVVAKAQNRFRWRFWD
jgi:hypothetical protein